MVPEGVGRRTSLGPPRYRRDGVHRARGSDGSEGPDRDGGMALVGVSVRPSRVMDVRSAKCEVRGAGWGDAGVLTPALRTSHVALLLVALAVLAPCRLSAQVPPPPDSAASADSARVDSLRNDATDRLIAAEARE